ncbi:MAG TPA: DUF998 domain-containing protein [Rhodothermales bacterium]|nr:DUF998 domain-containing protein [Rhodothermales bacterium]
MLKSNYNIVSTALFVLAIVVAHIFSTNSYDWTKNTISDLGSQGYDRKLIMQFGFLAFGLTLSAGILANGLTWQSTPILIYGLCVGLTGIFCTQPFFNVNNYSATEANIHSVLAQIAGMAFTLGILVQLLNSADKSEKWIHFTFFILVVGLSASFGLVKDYQGIAQRLLYLASFIWLIRFFKP